MKKLFASLLVVAMLAGCQSTAATTDTSVEATAEAAGVTGTFEGTSEGFGGDVTVSITLEDSKLIDAVITGEKETPAYGGKAIEAMQAAMLENATVNVDSFTGATFTSTAIQEGIVVALEAAGLTSADFPVIEKISGQIYEETATVVVVGAGGAGLTFANSAVEAGIEDVLVLEKMSFVGGATTNAGGIDAGMSKLQAELGIEGDSVELIKSDILRSGTGHNEALVDIVANYEGLVLDWLRETENVPFNDRYSGDFPEHTVQRFFVCDGGMANAMSILAENFQEKGGRLQLNTTVTELIQDEEGNVIGVKAVDADDNTYVVSADAVVIATGGYGANEEMISEKKSDLSYAVFYGAHSSMGEGHKLGESVGAKMTLMGYAKLYPNGIAQPGTNDGKATPLPTLNTVNQTGSIFVNKDGNRFVNETLAFADIKNATCEQPDEIMYLVMDQAGFDMWSEQVQSNSSAAGHIDAETMESYFESDDTWPTFTKGTIAEAAEKAGIDAEQLAKTVAEWNETVSAGSDEFGREALIEFDTDSTVYIVEQRLRFATTLGGFDITANFEAQKEDGTVIPGLYAIGEVVGGPNGTEAIPGSMACWAVTSGYVLGQQLGETLGK